MVKCSYCKADIKPGRGVTFVEVSGKVHHLCSNKCKVNLKMKRDPKKVKWIIKKR